MTSRLRSLAMALAAGSAAGLIAKWSDENGPAWLAELGTELPLWVTLTVAIGWFAASRGRAATVAGAFFVAMTSTYYGWSVLVLGYPFERAALIWFALATVVCPVVTVTVTAARRSLWTGSVALGAAAALVGATGNVRGLWLQVTGALGEDAPDRVLGGVLDLAMACLLVLLTRSTRGILIAALAAVVLFWPVAVLYDTVSSRIPLP